MKERDDIAAHALKREYTSLPQQRDHPGDGPAHPRGTAPLSGRGAA